MSIALMVLAFVLGCFGIYVAIEGVLKEKENTIPMMALSAVGLAIVELASMFSTTASETTVANAFPASVVAIVALLLAIVCGSISRKKLEGARETILIFLQLAYALTMLISYGIFSGIFK